MNPAPDAVFPWWYSRRNHATWTRLRERGAARFILVNGIAWYGGLMFVILSLLLPMAGHSWQLPDTRDLALGAAAWGSAGLLWGASMWHLSEYNFRKYSASTGTNQP